MAVGFSFLSKTSGMKDIMASKAAGAATSGAKTNSTTSSQNTNATSNASNPNMATMNTSDLIKYVYNNSADTTQESNAQGSENKDDKDNGKIKLPLTVEYGDEKYSSHGKELDVMITEISQKTGDSVAKVESELKRKYGGTKGAKNAGTFLNMQA